MQTNSNTVLIAAAVLLMLMLVSAYGPALYAEAQARGNNGEAGLWAFLSSLFA